MAEMRLKPVSAREGNIFNDGNAKVAISEHTKNAAICRKLARVIDDDKQCALLFRMADFWDSLVGQKLKTFKDVLELDNAA